MWNDWDDIVKEKELKKKEFKEKEPDNKQSEDKEPNIKKPGGKEPENYKYGYTEFSDEKYKYREFDDEEFDDAAAGYREFDDEEFDDEKYDAIIPDWKEPGRRESARKEPDKKEFDAKRNHQIKFKEKKTDPIIYEEKSPAKEESGEKCIFRHELKYQITAWQKEIFAKRVGCFLQRDTHAEQGVYTIRSLYFDDSDNTAYEEKRMGVSSRKKYRIRCYNYSDRTIHLECKNKQGAYIYKEAALLSREDTERIIAGDYRCMAGRKEPVCQNFYYQCMTNQMRPRVIVDYERIPFVFLPGDVRVTFDYNIREAVLMGSFFDEMLPAFDVMGPDELIMEVKFTAFLPEFIRDILTTQEADCVAASKYVMCCDSKIRRIGMLV